jgi:hypothetical protein
VNTVEKVARAIAKADGQINFKTLPEILKFAYTLQARAAIEAMREPSRDMIERATDGEMAKHVSPNHAAIVWQLAIDAALENWNPRP